MITHGFSHILPNFLIVGAGKSGTTSLYHYLAQHPEVFTSPLKEPRFLSMGEERTFNGPGGSIVEKRSVSNFEDYCALFKNSESYKARGEASVDNLSFHYYAIPNIKKYIGDPKIIIVLRNPVDRAYSAYTYLRRDGWEKLSFADALRQESERKKLGYRWMWRYREAGLYYEQVKAYVDNFEQVKIFLYDELRSAPLNLIQNIYAFLEVNPSFIPTMSTRHNSSGNPRSELINSIFVKPKTLHKVVRSLASATIGLERWIVFRENVRGLLLKKPDPIDPDIANELRAYYKEDILKLQSVIGKDLSSWLTARSQ